MLYYRQFQLKSYNSFNLSSIAKNIWFPEDYKELQELVIKIRNSKYEILGRGTNVLLNKEIERVVCLSKLPQKIKISSEFIWVTGNFSLTRFVNECAKQNIGGYEGLYGIPGAVGGAIRMNAGSGKYTISDNLINVVVISSDGEIKIYSKKELKFSRRYSLINETKEIIIGALFKRNLKLNVEEIKKAKEHRMKFPPYPSAGGIFKNWHSLKPHTKKLVYLNHNGAEVYTMPNIIINKNDATIEDIFMLISKIKTIVKTPLELEVQLIGF